MKMLPEFYKTHLQSQLKPAQYLDLQQIVFLLQLQKLLLYRKISFFAPGSDYIWQPSAQYSKMTGSTRTGYSGYEGSLSLPAY